MRIHSLFILKKEGICIYKRNFTEEFDIDEDLTSGFFSAIFSIAEELTSRKLEILEMGDLRFIFKLVNDYIFVILCDIDLSLVFASNFLEDLSNIIPEYIKESNLSEYQCISNACIDQVLDSITNISDIRHAFFTYAKMDEFKEFFEKLKHEGELVGAALFMTNGIPVYLNLPNIITTIFLKEFEINNKAGVLSIPKMIRFMENGQKIIFKMISDKKGNLLLVLLFDSYIALGTADISMDKIIKQLMILNPYEGF